MRRTVIKSLFPLWGLLLIFGCSPSNVPPFSKEEQKPAGDMTAKRLSDRSYVEPGASISNTNKLAFWTGFSLFRDPWVIAPSSTKDRDGLGPLFNTRSCISCHLAGGRGEMSTSGVSKPSTLVIRVGGQPKQGLVVDPHYGGQIQPRSIAQVFPGNGQPLKGEARLLLSYQDVKGSYPDGTQYTLRKPSYTLTDLYYGELHEGMGLSPRFAPHVYGVGLLDAIADSDLIALEDIADKDEDGISAKYNRVPNVLTGNIQIGRFGLKAKHPNLRQQIAAAFRDDIGITNSLFPSEPCTRVQVECAKTALYGGHENVEIPDKLLKLVNEFNLYLSVPPARDLTNDKVQLGRAKFYEVQCAHCHTPSFTTDSNYPITELAGQKIWPYSNLALHDMGEDLADEMTEYHASRREWRTPPLWGIGLQEQFKGEAHYLHDGRARSLEEAILWHGGEAQQSKLSFMRLSKKEREALIAFVKAI